MTVTVAAATPAHVPQLLTRLEEMDQFYGDTTDGSPEARAGQLRQALFGDPPAGYALAALDGDEVCSRTGGSGRASDRTPQTQKQRLLCLA
ncbi:hypothetical protein GCM10009727_52210 [Actinomadura napierensis]|uniref:GNAT family N-acetyltransferase n=1 Tax=Actinomadura napierensis TaxID=267854 RepID=A0ABN2ZWE7_9ACTN